MNPINPINQSSNVTVTTSRSSTVHVFIKSASSSVDGHFLNLLARLYCTDMTVLNILNIYTINKQTTFSSTIVQPITIPGAHATRQHA